MVNNILYLKTKNKMIGYISKKTPFDKSGWYNTRDLVERRSGGFIKIVGRKSSNYLGRRVKNSTKWNWKNCIKE